MRDTLKFKTRALTEQELMNQEKEEQMEYNRIMNISDEDEEKLSPELMKELDSLKDDQIIL